MIGWLRRRKTPPPPMGVDLPNVITDFLRDHHVLSLAVVDAAGLWAASCFYAPDAAVGDLIVLSAVATRHGRAMLAHPGVAGSISGQPTEIRAIQGVQFTAIAARLADADRDAAMLLYGARHPVARLAQTDVWRLRLETVKLTDNRRIFGAKTHWSRDGAISASV